MKAFFNPKTIALIGATQRKSSVGLALCQNLSNKKVFFVNPNRKKLFGKKCFPSILDIKTDIDLAIIAVPQKVVLKVAREVTQKKVKAVIIISAGFAEIGNDKEQRELSNILKEIRFLGPNCMGIINPYEKLNASFSKLSPEKGKVAFLSQSGALMNTIMDYDFSSMVSFGNAQDVDVSDLIDYFAKHEKTKAIALYIEGLKNGSKFINACLKCKKPIVVLKGGKTKRGKKAVQTHTASLAGNEKIYSAAFKKAGLFEVDTLKDLMEVSNVLSFLPSCKNSIGVLTNGGAVGVLASDWLSKFGVKVREVCDIRGDALSSDYEKALKKLLSKKEIKGLIVAQTLQAMTEPKKNALVLKRIQKKYPKKPIIALFLGGFNPCFFEIRRACLCIKALIWKGELLK